jgi:hypothetical protein
MIMALYWAFLIFIRMIAAFLGIFGSYCFYPSEEQFPK